MKRTLIALSLVSLAGGCAKKSAATASPPMAADAAGYEDGYAESEAAPSRSLDYVAPASFDELQAELDQLDANLSAEGITADGEFEVGATSSDAGPNAKKTEEGTRCERICGLKEAICDVADRICGLAEEHEGESKYTDACTRATNRCEQATGACDTCEE